MAQLIRKGANGDSEVLELNLGLNRFGRHPDSHFPINHKTISAFHAEIVLSAEGVLLRDCGSTNGTFVNEQPVQEMLLLPGQTIRLGDVEFFVESTDVKISIPTYERQRPAPPIVLADGSILCRRHPEARGTHRCTFCKEILCDTCVTKLRRKGGKTLKLCSQCHHGVELIGPEKKKKRSLLSLLNTTLHLPFIHPKRDE